MRQEAALALAVLLAGCVAAVPDDADPAAASTPGREPLVVLAHLDTGINPYARAFRDDSPLARAHPSTYLPGYPADARALVLSLDEADWATAFEKDKAAWEAVEPGVLYYVPGTRIVGAISFGAGGTNCPPLDTPPFTYVGGDCPERRILDDHGHGTMTASRAAASRHSLCPACRIVSIEGPGAEAVRWAADQGWIDVQTNSWLSLVPPPASGAGDGTAPAFAYAAERMLVVAASGNGAAYLGGFAPTPTYALSTGAPGVVLVGAHDNGRVAAWSGAPPHLVADGFGGPTALRDRIDDLVPHPVACCTSAAAPYAAGGGAALVLEARRILGDGGVGLRDGALAVGNATIAQGPLADGRLTLDELRLLLQRTADPRPKEG
ncbi:MAG TPA: S8/S53 family peptidase, partial [Candidatus Thermoplasmatota archaeon]|nr:S8/S53 family peptidase [Candidatus Thermoplasmatota archaeon]